MWDVTLIVNYGQLLRDALKQAPLEKHAVLVHTKLATLEKLKAERNEGWSMSQRMAELEYEMKQVGPHQDAY